MPINVNLSYPSQLFAETHVITNAVYRDNGPHRDVRAYLLGYGVGQLRRMLNDDDIAELERDMAIGFASRVLLSGV